jgi:glycosyltransferase involved in cell wall biosynthesis
MNLLILTGLFPPDTGGPATYVPRIASALKQRNFNVEIITAGLSKTEQSFDFTVNRVPRTLLRRLPRSYSLIKDRLQWADVLYVNGLEVDHRLASIGSNTPVIQKIVGDRSWEKYQNRSGGNLTIDEFQTSFPGMRSWIERTLHRWVNRFADQYIVPSHYLKELIQHWGIKKDTITVIHNHSLPPSEIPSKNITWPDGSKKLLTVGRLVRWKKVNQLVKVLTDFPECSLIVLGDGPRRSVIKETIEDNNLRDRVQLKGNVSRASVWNHLNQADLLVLNSTYEGFPHVLLESVRSGLPAIARASGGSDELKNYFPEAISTYGFKRRSLEEALEKNSTPQDFDSPEKLPEPLQWDTIVKQTAAKFQELTE